MILYIAGPMTGLPEFNYPAFFKAEEKLASLGYDTLNPARNHGNDWQEYMRAGITQVCASDGIAFLPFWERSRGASLEIRIARELGIPIQAVDAWVADMEPINTPQEA